MKTNNKFWILIVAITLTVINNVEAQVQIGGLQEYVDYANINISDNRVNNPYAKFKGSPFLTADFNSGQIELKNGKIYEGLLRYDIYADQIEFKTADGNIYAVRNPEVLGKITIHNSQFISFSKVEGNSISGIYEILADGVYLLIEKHKVELKDPVAAKPYVAAKPASFSTKKSKYFILNLEGEFIEINNKKDLLTLRTEKSNEVEKFIKKNKIKTSKKRDLIKFVNFLNQDAR
jgi:hypothetical protein